MKYVVVDNDCGIDDAWALNVLLNSKSSLELLAITCVNGNTDVDHVCANNSYFLKVAGKSEIPVFRGAEKPLLPRDLTGIPGPDHKYFHGKNGFGDVQLPTLEDMPVIQNENAVVALHRISIQYKGELSLICCGPLTNIALALRTYHDFKHNIKEIFIMGGNFTAMGNTTMSAEFNFHVDPEAAHIVLSELSKKITLLPWETCLNIDISFDWREEFGASEGKIMSLLNKIEKPIIARSKKVGYKHYITADQLLAAIFINSDVLEIFEEVYATVELGGLYTRGQLVIDHLGSNVPNITLVKSINSELYKEILSALKDL